MEAPESTEPKGSVNSTIDAVAGLAKAIPVYQDAVQPAAQEIGKALHTVTKLVNVALTPIAGSIWAFEKIQNWLVARLSEKLQNVPSENIITPPISIAAPIINNLIITTDNGLADAFLNLLAKASNNETVKLVHPSFATALSNMSSDEAKILFHFREAELIPSLDAHVRYENNGKMFVLMSNYYTGLESSLPLDFKENLELYFANLVRLEIFNCSYSKILTGENVAERYSILEATYKSEAIKKYGERIIEEPQFRRGFIGHSEYGVNFINACISEIKTT